MKRTLYLTLILTLLQLSLYPIQPDGYVVAGYTYDQVNGDQDAFVQKIDLNGNSLWQNSYGGSANDRAYAIIQTDNINYCFAGYTYSQGNGGSDMWVVKVNNNGTVAWEKTFGTTANEGAYGIFYTKSGGFIVCGYTTANGNPDMLIYCLDSQGNVVWQRTIGGSGWDMAYDVCLTSDHCAVIAGYSNSYSKGGDDDMRLVKLNASTGATVWEKSFGGSGTDHAYAVTIGAGGKYAIAGATDSYTNGNYDYYLVQVNIDGTKDWDNNYGFTGLEMCYDLKKASNDGFILVGRSEVSGNGTDHYFQKTNSDGTPNGLPLRFGNTFDNGATAMDTTTDGNFVVAGYDGLSGIWIRKINHSMTTLWDVSHTFPSNLPYAQSIARSYSN